MIGRIFRKICTLVFKFFNRRFKDAVLYSVPKVYFKNNLILGKKISFNDNVFIHAAGGVSIGNYCTLSHGVSILSTENDTSRWIARLKNEDIHINKPICIGNNVWLCTNVTICAGVTIADNIVVAAGAVVVSDLCESGCLYGGVPARKLKKI